jgi:hypothetical protein
MSPSTEPTTETYTWKSEAFGADAIILGEQEVTANTDYFILVTCTTYCRYRITVSYAEELNLVDGQPQQGTLTENHSEVYKYTVPPGHPANISIKVLPSRGRVKMFVTEGGDPSSYNSFPVTSTLQSGSQCNIKGTDPGTTFKIAVLALTDADFVISTVSSEGVSVLQSSKPTEGEVETEKFVYYKFYVDDPSELVTIQITAYGGDPDLYVRFNSQPSSSEFDFRSEMTGEETLALSQQDRSLLGGETGWYYIGVYGYYHSVFTITVSVNHDSVVPLLSGNSQQGFVDQGQVDMYYADVVPQTALNVTVRLTPTAGNPDLFMKLCTNSTCAFSTDLTSSDVLKSCSLSGDEVLSVTQPSSRCPSQFCRYLIAVVGQSSVRSVFSIMLTDNNNAEIVLRDGRAEHQSLAAGEERYYKFVVYNATVDEVSFMLTPEQGDPSLYVSRSAARPSRETAEKYCEDLNSAIESVKYEKGVDGVELNCTYHLTVRARYPATFSIIAKETVPSWNSTIRLLPGYAQLDTLQLC